MVDSTYSVYSSKLSEHIREYFIPGYGTMSPQHARVAKLRFFETGQVCTDAEWEQYLSEVADGRRYPTKLLLVEGGCDGFQPFRRRVWSKWLFGYRLACVGCSDGMGSQYEIVTAISSGASEGKAAQVVAGLDAQQLIQLAPPSAVERMHGATGAPPFLTCPKDVHVLRGTKDFAMHQCCTAICCCRDTGAGRSGLHSHVDKKGRAGCAHHRGRVGHLLWNTS
jgi:hypothetical protein